MAASRDFFFALIEFLFGLLYATHFHSVDSMIAEIVAFASRKANEHKECGVPVKFQWNYGSGTTLNLKVKYL